MFCSEFLALRELAAILADHSKGRCIPRLLGDRFSYFTDLPTMDDPAIDGMLAVEMRSGSVANEERAAISVGSTVRHRKDTFMCVSDPRLLISKLGSIRTQGIDTIVIIHDLSSLHHEARDDALEDSLLEVDIES